MECANDPDNFRILPLVTQHPGYYLTPHTVPTNSTRRTMHRCQPLIFHASLYCYPALCYRPAQAA